MPLDLIDHVTADCDHHRIIICKLPRRDSFMINPPWIRDLAGRWSVGVPYVGGAHGVRLSSGIVN